MSESRSASYEQFLRRYERLKADYFGPNAARVKLDDDGQEIPSCFMNQAQIANAFISELKVHVPVHRADPPRFLDGTIGPGYVSPRPATPPQKTQAPPSIQQVQAEAKAVPVYRADVIQKDKPKPKMVHCSIHGKSLACVMDDDILMCVNCYSGQPPAKSELPARQMSEVPVQSESFLLPVSNDSEEILSFPSVQIDEGSDSWGVSEASHSLTHDSHCQPGDLDQSCFSEN